MQAAIDDSPSLPHTASILSPYAFELRPNGFAGKVPNYRVFVERVAYRLHARIVPDYLAVSVVAAVVAGARHNPQTVERLRAAISKAGWTPDVELSTAVFRIHASFDDVLRADEMELENASVRIGLLLSDFVLDQLIITRPVGEMRPAVERPVGDESASEVWLYDPAERDRATQVHRSLENWLMAKLRERTIEPLDPAGEPYFDLAWRVGLVLHVCEVKSSSNNEVHQLRLGLGQIIQYRHLLGRTAARVPVMASILIEGPPADMRWVQICVEQQVLLFWPACWDDVLGELTSTAGLDER